ncbi:hypothetical protein F511_21073 [Dorcoceras hygrometricum]|uniref:Uncharacterized protein n=1 Tax=Dorcoceras hygrometricum TaxID=472368 RepID=A0A2Z7DFR6_9LAMI|nr:hypothetical protein F511_21073 [Dorcoceras hygrometricum]
MLSKRKRAQNMGESRNPGPEISLGGPSGGESLTTKQIAHLVATTVEHVLAHRAETRPEPRPQLQAEEVAPRGVQGNRGFEKPVLDRIRRSFVIPPLKGYHRLKIGIIGAGCEFTKGNNQKPLSMFDYYLILCLRMSVLCEDFLKFRCAFGCAIRILHAVTYISKWFPKLCIEEMAGPAQTLLVEEKRREKKGRTPAQL